MLLVWHYLIKASLIFLLVATSKLEDLSFSLFKGGSHIKDTRILGGVHQIPDSCNTSVVHLLVTTLNLGGELVVT